MTGRQPRFSKEEHARLGTAIYEQQVRFGPVETYPEFPQPLGKDPHKTMGIVLSLAYCQGIIRRHRYRLRRNTRYPVPGQGFRGRNLPPADKAELGSAH
jgi:hypothetical protein